MDGPVWTLPDIRKLWLQSGGSALYADIASAVAMATSGGRPSYVAQQEDGTVNRGLWGINSSRGSMSSHDPRANARAAIELSNNGTDWRSWQVAYDPTGYLGPTSPVRALTAAESPMGQYPTAGNRPTSQVASNSQNAASAGLGDVNIDLAGPFLMILRLLGIPYQFLTAYLRYTFVILAGASMMVFGFILMFVSLRQVKNVASFVIETGAAGAGFGAGAAILSGDRGRMRRALKPPPASGSTIAPKPPPTPDVPSGRHSSGTSVQETLLRARHRQPVSQGGSGLGSPVIAERSASMRTRKRRAKGPAPATEQTLFRRRNRPYNPLAGDSPGTGG